MALTEKDRDYFFENFYLDEFLHESFLVNKYADARIRCNSFEALILCKESRGNTIDYIMREGIEYNESEALSIALVNHLRNCRNLLDYKEAKKLIVSNVIQELKDLNNIKYKYGQLTKYVEKLEKELETLKNNL